MPPAKFRKSSMSSESVLQSQIISGGAASNIFATFPAEIVRLILENVGRDSGHMAVRLACVSSLVHGWILPILYETVILKRVQDLRHIQRNLTIRGGRAALVRNVCLQIELTTPHTVDALTEEIVAFLSQCPHITSIYLNSTSLPLAYDATRLPRLTHLHCGSWRAWMTHDVLAFRHITHLRADLAHNMGVHPAWTRLLTPPHALPHLTHLALGADGRAPSSEACVTAQFLRGVLAARPRLAMLVVTVWFYFSARKDTMFTDIVDVRLCVLVTQGYPSGVSSLMDWEDAARGRHSIWDRAGAIMAQHRARGGRGIAVDAIEWVKWVPQTFGFYTWLTRE